MARDDRVEVQLDARGFEYRVTLDGRGVAESFLDGKSSGSYKVSPVTIKTVFSLAEIVVAQYKKGSYRRDSEFVDLAALRVRIDGTSRRFRFVDNPSLEEIPVYLELLAHEVSGLTNW